MDNKTMTEFVCRMVRRIVQIEFHPTMHIFMKNVSKIGITLNLNRIRPAENSNKDENENLIMLRAFV